MPDGICPFAEWIPGVKTKGPEVWDLAGFCDHTAGGFMATMRNPNFWNTQGVSTHFAIGRHGQIIQLVNIFEQAWCQGKDMNGNSVGPNSPGITWPPFAQMSKRNPNGYLIGTEHEDAETHFGQTHFVPGSEWTPEQYNADLRVKRWCLQEAARRGFDALRFGVDSLASHHMFDPRNRAECAGRFWRVEYQQRLFNDLSGIPQPEPPQPEIQLEEEEMVIWAMWDEWTPESAVPFRSYLLQAGASGLHSYLVPSAEEHKALENSKIAGELVRVSLETLRAFGVSPDPSA